MAPYADKRAAGSIRSIFAAILSATVYVIVDIEFPRLGLIRVDARRSSPPRSPQEHAVNHHCRLRSRRPSDFSVVLGGPLFQLLRRTRLSDDALALVHRRIIAGVLITWVPLLAAVAARGARVGGGVTVPFLLNAEVQARFLIAMPLLVLAELGVHLRMRQLVAQFFNRDLVADEDLPRLHGRD